MDTQYRERPILFSTSMVRAILAGHKTQTRRIIPLVDGRYICHAVRACLNPETWEKEVIQAECKYGRKKDKLWVRETWATAGNYNDMKPSDLPKAMLGQKDIYYRATEAYGDAYCHWRPSIFMPRWASRITLEIVNVRVELLQEINNLDALYEGTPDLRTMENNWDLRRCYQELWDNLNASRGYGWDANPWVWVIEFRRTA